MIGIRTSSRSNQRSIGMKLSNNNNEEETSNGLWSTSSNRRSVLSRLVTTASIIASTTQPSFAYDDTTTITPTAPSTPPLTTTSNSNSNSNQQPPITNIGAGRRGGCLPTATSMPQPQFGITTNLSDYRELDKSHTVFGRVLTEEDPSS